MKNLYNIRKSLWILFCCMSLLAANGIPATLHAQERKRLTVEMTDAPILDVLKAIEAQSELSFFYNNNLIDPTLRITVSKRDAPIPEVLNRVFAGTPYAYRIVDKQVLISKKEDAPKPDEPLKIQGRVIDSKGGPIIGATVVNMRTLQGTVTGSDGRFELTVSALTEELTFNYIGFKTKVLPASNAEEVRLEEATVLEDVVVVGYGTVKRVNLTGSVATIDMREKANQPITNTAQAMYNTPGVWIFLAAFAGGLIQGASLRTMGGVLVATVKQMMPTVITMLSVLGCAKVMGYSGMISSISSFCIGVAGAFFPLVAPWIGMVGTFVTGSGTSSGMLFGQVQSEAAQALSADPYWMVALNSLGVAAGKMLSPQTLAIGLAAVRVTGKDAELLKAVLPYALAFLVGMSALAFIGA